MRSTRLGLLATLFVGIAALGGAGQAVAAPTHHIAAADSRYVGTYIVLSMCQTVGKQGVANGDWQTFTCAPARVGLDVWWDLWVSP